VKIAVVTGAITAGDLLADFLIATPSATLTVTPDMTGPLVWRLGARALRLVVLGARVEDVADAVMTEEEAARWIGSRSMLALDSAAMLIRHRGGDALERAEFARLFAIGEPQEGLAAFLEKRSARFGGKTQ